ncbi:DUF4190 domain-containing protein [Nocardiopsis sp. Huas11]|uniref:DUF4190 domain-containing protein n=1 Tax=Nocardiopsis sp. Huas11 TaxID=2183912 RepID=UPI0011C3FA8E|nr:DUF4190 domain-containing protein [Nocardiopsis sp. Huas11]
MTDTAAHDQGQERRAGGFSIAALVLGLSGFLLLPIPLAIVLGLIALFRIHRSPASPPPDASGPATAKTVGVIFSLVGIVAAGVWSIGWAAALVLVHDRAASGPYTLQDQNPPAPDAVPAVPADTDPDASADLCEPPPGYATVCTLQAGDCFIEPADREFYEIELIACDEPHNAQVIGSYSPSTGDWPGWSSFIADIDSACRPMSESALDPERTPDAFFIGYLAPDEEAWDSGVQEALCYVSTGGESWTTSLM